MKRSYWILPVLDDEDQARVVHACITGMVSARDAAITLLALTTKLRACDLVALRLADIDWRASTIGVVQQKTHNPLTLPLAPPVIARLVEYVLHERPHSGDGHVFLRCKAPHTRLADHASIYRVTATTFPDRRGERREGRHQAAAAQRRLPAAARVSVAADDTGGGPRACQRRVDQRVPERRRGRPIWQPRFVCFRAARELPAVAVAALRAEAFLQLPAWVRLEPDMDNGGHLRSQYQTRPSDGSNTPPASRHRVGRYGSSLRRVPR